MLMFPETRRAGLSADAPEPYWLWQPHEIVDRQGRIPTASRDRT